MIQAGARVDIANDRFIAGFESVLGPQVTIFGATSSDNMRGLVSALGPPSGSTGDQVQETTRFASANRQSESCRR